VDQRPIIWLQFINFSDPIELELGRWWGFSNSIFGVVEGLKKLGMLLDLLRVDMIFNTEDLETDIRGSKGRC
jgi:hypothetical protein